MAAAVVERDYGSVEYWERRYHVEPAPVDFYLGYGELIPYLEPVLSGDAKDVLVSGCGASELGAELSDRHAHKVTCVDACHALIKHMQTRYSAKDRLEYREMDCRDMRNFNNETFDCVLDKALFDVVLCGNQNLSSIALMTTEAFRVLKPGGAYVVVTHGAPQTRLGYLERPALNWRVTVLPVQKPKISKAPHRADDVYYAYICRKANREPSSSEASLY